MSSSEKDEALPSPPCPPALVVGGSPRRSSVTLTPTWRNHKLVSLLDSTDENQEAHAMAFFPISTTGTPSSPALFRRPSSPSKEADLATVVLPSPRSPGSRNSVIFGSFRRKSLSKKGGAAAESDVDDALTTDDDDTGSSIDSADLKDLAADFWHDVPEAPGKLITIVTLVLLSFDQVNLTSFESSRCNPRHCPGLPSFGTLQEGQCLYRRLSRRKWQTMGSSQCT